MASQQSKMLLTWRGASLQSSLLGLSGSRPLTRTLSVVSSVGPKREPEKFTGSFSSRCLVAGEAGPPRLNSETVLLNCCVIVAAALG